MPDQTRKPSIRPQAATPIEDLDQIVADLKTAAPRWVSLPIDERIALLDRVIADTVTATDGWVADACEVQRIPPDSQTVWEETVGGPVLLIRGARLLRDTLADIRDHGSPRPPGPVTQRPDGQTVVGVFPTDRYDRALYPGVTGEVWMEPGINPGNLSSAVASKYRPGASVQPGVTLVLGAGNVASIGPLDLLHQLVNKLSVVILKAHPVNDYLVPHWRRALGALIEQDFAAVVAGGPEVGHHLAHHDDVDAVHLTGSDRTHDTIVFGPGVEGAARKAADEPVLTKPITAELGNVTPVIVVPGPWSDREIEFQAADVAGGLVQNAGFNCTANRVIVTHAQWNQREQFLDAVRRKLEEAPPRFAYYPGASERWHAFTEAHPHAETFGPTVEGCVPWTLIEGLDPADGDNIAYRVEAFNGLFVEVALDVERDVPAFLEAAVEFANESLWGSLSATIIAHPSTLRDPRLAAAVDRAIADLRYGTVSVNAWVALGYGLLSPTWGPFPGHHRTDIQSGTGTVHNTFLFDHPQKSVIRSPFRTPIPPVWHVGARPARATRALVELEADPSPTKLAKVVAAALRG